MHCKTIIFLLFLFKSSVGEKKLLSWLSWNDFGNEAAKALCKSNQEPWLVKIMSSDEWLTGQTKTCNGVIISKNLLLTSTHCASRTVNEHRLMVRTVDGQLLVTATDLLRPESKRGQNPFWDVPYALLQLKNELPFSRTVGPLSILKKEVSWNKFEFCEVFWLNPVEDFQACSLTVKSSEPEDSEPYEFVTAVSKSFSSWPGKVTKAIKQVKFAPLVLYKDGWFLGGHVYHIETYLGNTVVPTIQRFDSGVYMLLESLGVNTTQL